MEKREQLVDYIGTFLNTPIVDEKIVREIPNVMLILKAYIAGLGNKSLKPLVAFDFVENPELSDIPTPFHTLIGHAAIIKSKEVSSPVMHYLLKNCDKLLDEMRQFYTPR